MKAKCITAVQAAANGRPISPAKLQAIDDAINGKMRELARRDPNWQSYSRDQRMAQAADAAMKDIQAQAQLKEYRAGLQVLRAAESDERIRRAMALNDLTRSQGLIRDIELTETYNDAVRNEAISGLKDLMDAASNKDGTGIVRRGLMTLFDVDNPAMTIDVVREVFKSADGHTGNAAAKAGARAWLDTIEAMRQRFNAGGGDVGKLGYGYLSQAHDQMRVMDAGAAKWAHDVLPLLDRKQYVNADGTLMDDAAVRSLLESAHETIATSGDNKVAPGQFKGTGARANRGNESRVIHFADGDAWMAYMGKYGEGSLYDAMMSHIGAMSRDIALVERHGPNPEQWFRVQSDIAERADGAGTKANRAFLNKPQAYWDIASGKANMPENRLIQRVGQDVRNVQTAAKLGSAVLSAINDVGIIFQTLHYNRLPYLDMLSNISRRLAPGSEEADFLAAHGHIAESAISSLNRWAGEHMTHSLIGRVASSVMKLSLMNAWTDGLRGAFASTLMQGFAKKLGTAWKDLDAWDKYLMERKGITEADWGIITQAKATERGGLKYLTFDAVKAIEGGQQAATKWLSFVNDEAQFAVVNPDLAARAFTTVGGMKAGTPTGETARSAMQFKSFPATLISRHWRRVFETPQGLDGAPMGFGAEGEAAAQFNRIAVMASLAVSATILGAIVLQIKSLAQGKDPFDMTEPEFWARAFAQGGGASFIGDALAKPLDGTTPGRGWERAVGVVAGPAGGALGGVLDLTLGNMQEAAAGKDPKAAAEAIRLANSNLPYANLWQTRAMWEHWVLHNAQEAANPGYLSRMRQRAMRDYGQDFWWTPGEFTPDRAPDFEAARGR